MSLRKTGVPTSNFTLIPNEIARADWLSLSAFRVLVNLASHSDGYDLTQSAIAKMTGLKTDTVSKAIKELERHGIVSRTKRPGRRGQFPGYNYHLHFDRMTAPEPTESTVPKNGMGQKSTVPKNGMGETEKTAKAQVNTVPKNGTVTTRGNAKPQVNTVPKNGNGESVTVPKNGTVEEFHRPKIWDHRKQDLLENKGGKQGTGNQPTETTPPTTTETTPKDFLSETATANADGVREFPDHCAEHRHTPPELINPNGKRPGACGGCARQRQANEAAKRTEETIRKLGIKNCGICDNEGNRYHLNPRTGVTTLRPCHHGLNDWELDDQAREHDGKRRIPRPGYAPDEFDEFDCLTCDDSGVRPSYDPAIDEIIVVACHHGPLDQADTDKALQAAISKSLRSIDKAI